MFVLLLGTYLADQKKKKKKPDEIWIHCNDHKEGHKVIFTRVQLLVNEIHVCISMSELWGSCSRCCVGKGSAPPWHLCP